MKYIILLAATLATVSWTAHAADLPEPPVEFPTPPAAPPLEEPPQLDWTSPYLGFSAGYGISKATIDDWLCEIFPGGRVGAFIGQNWTVYDSFVVGVEGDVGYDWNSRAFNGAREVGTGLNASGRLRTGYIVGPALAYVAGGWTGTNAYLKDPDDEEFVHGWTMGAGVDWAVSESTFLRVEYRFNSYDKAALRGIDTKFEQSSINVGLAVRF